MKTVCSGELYADIDVYGGVIAYAELLRLLGHEARAVITPSLNGSIPEVVRSWPVKVERTYTSVPDERFSIIDVSNPDHFDTFVDRARVETVIDHHVGFEQYWLDRIGPGANIDFIGAACTLVYEAWERTGLEQSMSEVSARLLACGILDNTLNFTAKVTSDRDHAAYGRLLELGHLDHAWAATYFRACEEGIAKDAVGAIENDSKLLDFRTFQQPVLVGQIAVWDGRSLLRSNKKAFERAFSQKQSHWMVNLISIGEKKSYFLANNSSVQRSASALLGVGFEQNLAVSPRVWMRKEIIKADQEAS